MNDEVKLCECIAVEDDWLDISYTQRHYIEDEQDALMLVRTSVFKKRKKALNNAKKWIARCFVAIFVIATLVAMRFVDDGFMGEVFATAKQSYSQNVIQVISQSQQKQSTINLPINVTVDKVDNGTVIVSGGKVLLNFKNITETV